MEHLLSLARDPGLRRFYFFNAVVAVLIGMVVERSLTGRFDGFVTKVSVFALEQYSVLIHSPEPFTRVFTMAACNAVDT